MLHANYWLSGVAGHRLKHELDLPMVSTFHTLARVKAETGDVEPQNRIDAESDVIACSDIITANSVVELHELVRHYGAIRAASRSCRLASTTPSSRLVPAAVLVRPSASAMSPCCSSSAASSR